MTKPRAFLAAMTASDWWTLAVFGVAIAGTLLAGLPWWIHGPATLLLITLLSRAHGSGQRRIVRRLDEGSSLAERYHAEHRARLDDLELVASYGPGSLIPARAEAAALNEARIAVANRIGRRHPAA